MTEDTPAIWVKVDVDATGTYLMVVEYNPDRTLTLDRPAALAYAAEVNTAAAYADYDAAIMAQMTHLGAERAMVAATVARLRKQRPPLNQDALGPLHLLPSVSAFTANPFLRCSLTSHPMVWQWSPADARQHTGHVLECLPVAALDHAYRGHLVDVVGLPLATARLAVEDLARWRRGTDPGEHPA